MRETDVPPAAAPFASTTSSGDGAASQTPALDAFRDDVLDGLRRSQKVLPSKYFYDAEGSRLFDEITRLEAYYPTRAETQILRKHGAEMGQLIGPDARIVEYGSGSSEKTHILLAALEAPAAYVPIDISPDALYAAAERIRGRFPRLTLAPVVADYTASFDLPETPGRRTVVFFPGSTIGNFEPGDAEAFLREMGCVAGADGAVLIGVDLRKDRATLEQAYDDDEGVTAAFNFNLLERINQALGGTFDLSRFTHRAWWNERLGRVEMHLVSLSDQVVSVAGEPVTFRESEYIHTENSYKYTPEGFAALAARAGLKRTHLWTDAAERFSVQYLVVRPS